MSPQLPTATQIDSRPQVLPLRLDRVLAYLVLDERPVLVDTGLPSQRDTLIEQLALHGIKPEDLALIVITHAHADHSGNLQAFCSSRTPTVPAAAHPLAAQRIARGRCAPFAESLRIGRLLRPIITRFPRIEPVKVELQTDTALSLEPYGVRGTLLPTPGHTKGCLSIVLEDGNAIVGDLLRPGMFLRNGRRAHWVLNDPATWRQSIERLLELDARRFFAGHGGPFSRAQVEELLHWVK